MTMKEVGVRLAVLMLLIITAHLTFAAQIRFDVVSHEIKIQVDKEGYAHVTETFELSFPNFYVLQKFKELELASVRLEDWQQFNSEVHTYIGTEEDIKPGSAYITFRADKYLEINYKLKKPIMEKIREEGRMVEYSLKQVYFNKWFLKKPYYEIPDKTTISIILPQRATIAREAGEGNGRYAIQPEAAVKLTEKGNYIVTWIGPQKIIGSIKLRYIYMKPLAPNISPAALLQDFIKNTNREQLTLLAAVVILVALIFYIIRNRVEQAVSKFVLKHSEIE